MSDTKPLLVGSSGATLRETFGKTLTDIMPDYPNVIVLDADVAGGTGTHHVRTRHPDRFYQIGIAEQNMFCVAAGFEVSGLVPVVSTFAVFALRAYEMIRLSIACDRRNVKIVCSHPGLDTGPDGASAQCLEDLGVFIALPHFTVVSPADHTEMALATKAMLNHTGPLYMRSGRSGAPTLFDSSHTFKIGRGLVLQDGTDITLVACGVQVERCLEAAKLLQHQGISAQVVNMSTIKPLDDELLVACAQKTGAVLTSEDHNRLTGLGAQVARVLGEQYPVPLYCHGVDDTFGESGEPEELVEKYGLSATHIAAHAEALIRRKRV